MKPSEIPDKRKVFVGVDCKDGNIKVAFVNLYGKFLGSSLTGFPKDPVKFAKILNWTIRGLRGDVNLRMKNFVGIGISFANPELEFNDSEIQITEKITLPIYIEDYESMKQLGQDWINFLGKRTGIPEKSDLTDLYVAYGLVKIMRLKTSSNLELE